MQKSNPLRAITTRYKGYAFRSRLEARWAVFFDHLKIRWEYEPEGFELGNGLRYLPDFWLPDWEMWVEVKASAPDDVTREKARRLADQSGRPIFITEGMPLEGGTLVTHPVVFGVVECQAEIDWGATDLRVAWAFTDELAENTILYPWGEAMEVYAVKAEKSRQNGNLGWWTPPAQDALAAARSSRFEFGAKGGVK